jgi:hypothetical protein
MSLGCNREVAAIERVAKLPLRSDVTADLRMGLPPSGKDRERRDGHANERGRPVQGFGGGASCFRFETISSNQPATTLNVAAAH